MPQRRSGFSLFSFLAMIASICTIAALIYHFGFSGNSVRKAEPAAGVVNDTAKSDSASEAAVDLTEGQLKAVKIEPAVTHNFRIEKEVIGSIAYHEKDADGDKRAAGTSRFAVANVPESDSPLIRLGQPVVAKLLVYPDHSFSGKISALGITAYDSGGNPAIDPATHRIAVRCEIADPKNELYPGMLANLVVQVQKPTESVAIPLSGVAREGDGTLTVWVTADRKRFEKRTVKVGLQQDGYDQILEGLKSGELVATDGALFIDNALTTASQ